MSDRLCIGREPEATPGLKDSVRLARRRAWTRNRLHGGVFERNNATDVFATDDPTEGEALTARRFVIPTVERLLEDVGVRLPALPSLIAPTPQCRKAPLRCAPEGIRTPNLSCGWSCRGA
jgi:hypothetical protein